MAIGHFLEALRFLTILPLPGRSSASATSATSSTSAASAASSKSATSGQGIAASIAWFPLVGLAIGLLLLLVGWLASLAWDDSARAALLVVAWAVITAGLHLDGLSDTFDAVMSWRPRERKLEIMKDSRVGAMGVVALVSVLLLKFVLLQQAGAGWWRAALLAPVLARWADTYAICWFATARAGGLGRAFQSQARQRDFVIASIITLLLAVGIAQWHGLAAGVGVWLCSHLLAYWWARDLGGLTGDTYGALCEIGEVVALAALTALTA